MLPDEVAALALGPPVRGRVSAALVHGTAVTIGDLETVRDTAARLEAARSPRWVWWSAESAARPLVQARVPVARAWDVAEAHRLLHGGGDAAPASCWAAAHGRSPDSAPLPPADDLFDHVGVATPSDDSLVDGRGYLRADHLRWIEEADHLADWARAAIEVAERQYAIARAIPRLVGTILAESATAVLCLELERDGLPLDRARVDELITQASGPRGTTPHHEEQARRRRDERVLRHLPGRGSTDLRSPAQVRQLLAAVGVDVPNTRKWVLEPYRTVHPVVDALLVWRRDERIATTYGYRWLDTHVGADDRLRGRWTACDAAAGRMTAENGLHNLPVALRSGVAAGPGHVFLRADLGQVEPRVLAVVSGDRALAAATAENDLYAPVAQQLGVPRAVAKVAVLAAMYGQRSGAAGEALRGLEQTYPRAMALLERAYESGRRGQPLRTWGGRLVPTGRFLAARPPGGDADLDAARGRFARNAVIQGSAAELFKAWTATVRATTRDLGAVIVLCLHDELLVHAPEAAADEVAVRVTTALTDAARRWSSGAPVRFVADIAVVRRWSEAKD
ncbi:MAG: DNA polymerase [Dermatophilaceae bacterium]